MNSYISPVVVTIPDAVGLDAAIQKLGAKLAALPWLETIYGRAIAQRAKGENGTDISFPEVWGQNREPQNIMPNDNLMAYAFFVARDPEGIVGFQPLDDQLFIAQPVSVIVWADLKKIDPTRDYRYSEELKIALLKQLTASADFAPGQVYESYLKIFEGFTITETYRQFLKPPFWACRIDGTLSYALYPENCPPELAGDFNNDFNNDFLIQGASADNLPFNMPTFANKAELIAYINSNINTNGANNISGAEVNSAMIATLLFTEDYETLGFKLSEDSTTLQLPDDTKSCIIYQGGRLPDNSLFPEDPAPDGYTFDTETKVIEFASMRLEGERFIVDIVK